MGFFNLSNAKQEPLIFRKESGGFITAEGLPDLKIKGGTVSFPFVLNGRERILRYTANVGLDAIRAHASEQGKPIRGWELTTEHPGRRVRAIALEIMLQAINKAISKK